MKFKNWLQRGALVAAALVAATVAYAAPPVGWTKVAEDKAKFTLRQFAAVAYGAGNSYVTKDLYEGQYVCSPSVFITDPAPGVKKACYANLTIPTGPAPAAGTVLSTDNTFTLPAPTIVQFGAGAQTVQRTLVAGAYRCGSETFAIDPAPGIKKSCISMGASGSTPIPAGPGPYLATVGGTFVLNNTRVVAFGVGGTGSTYVEATLNAGTNACAVSTFPSDPSPGNTKYCYDKGDPPVVTPPTGPGPYLATQGGNFTLTESTIVAYGVGGQGASYVQATLTAGTKQCATSAFPSDPAPGSTKYCYSLGAPVVGNAPAGPGVFVAEQDSTFVLTELKTVAYGENGKYYEATLPAGTRTCNNVSFGGDPSPSNPKYCYVTDLPTAPSAPVMGIPYQYLSPGYDEEFNNTAKPMLVIYGDEDGPYREAVVPVGTWKCQEATFGGDPEFGTTKACRILGNGLTTDVTTETNNFVLKVATTVYYGAGGQYKKSRLPAGSYTCGSSTFGTVPVGIPANATRRCIAEDNPTPSSYSKTAPMDDAILTGGAVDATKYAAVAATFGTDAGVSYRYGPSAFYYGTTTNVGLPNYAQRPDAGTYFKPEGPNGESPPNCNGYGYCPAYQFGTFKYDPGDYSSSGIQVAYLPDATPDPAFWNKRYYGIASYQQIGVAHNTMLVRPQMSWTLFNGYPRNGADNDVNMELYAGLYPDRKPSWITSYNPDNKPVAMTRCYGRGGWCTNPVAVWADGRITAHGSNTNHNMMTAQLAAGKTPTGITITNSGEFALITVWDTVNTKGQVAVVALADGCEGCSPVDESQWYRNWGNARQVYAGLPGLGNYVYAKVLGYVDLPSDMKAPTEIWASTLRDESEYGRSQFWEDEFTVEANRKMYYGIPKSGSSQDINDAQWKEKAIARTGIATVISKSEKKVAFIDLRPLFSYYREQYLNSTQANFNAMIANRGPAANQWPYTFANTPSQMPTVIKTVTMDSAPTAVKMPNFSYPRSIVATQDGKLHVFSLGTKYLDQMAAQVGSPSDITELFTVDVGRNVTDIALIKEHGWETGYDTSTYSTDGVSKPDISKYLIVNSRGDRKIQWIKFNNNWTSAAVSKTLQDAKLIDPISIEDADNHGTESYVLSIADYAGRKVHNMLYGRIIMHTYQADAECSEIQGGCSLLGNNPFEYAGNVRIPGQVVHVRGQNIN